MRRIELLSKAHDRDGFDCGSPPLNLFLQQTARQHAERGISRTFVLVDRETSGPSEKIQGYFSLNLCQLSAEELPPQEAKRLPRDVAGLKLGRLAVAKDLQGQGIGKFLLIEAMQKALDIFEIAGGIGLFVDAKDLRAAAYYEKFGFVVLPSDCLRLFLPLKTIREALDN